MGQDRLTLQEPLLTPLQRGEQSPRGPEVRAVKALGFGYRLVLGASRCHGQSVQGLLNDEQCSDKLAKSLSKFL